MAIRKWEKKGYEGYIAFALGVAAIVLLSIGFTIENWWFIGGSMVCMGLLVLGTLKIKIPRLTRRRKS